MIIFALSTGLRVGELTGLRWADVDMKESVVNIRQQLIYKNLGDGCKFHIQGLKTEAGRRDIPLTENAEHRRPELLPHVSAHILRHTACTRLAESGLEPKVLQYIVGHANVSVTLDVYTHLDFTQIQEKIEALQENMKIG